MISFFALIYCRRQCDASVLSYQTARMPEQILLKVGGISSAQFSVYNEFAQNIPGFQPMSERDVALLLQKATVSVRKMRILPHTRAPHTHTGKWKPSERSHHKMHSARWYECWDLSNENNLASASTTASHEDHAESYSETFFGTILV